MAKTSTDKYKEAIAEAINKKNSAKDTNEILVLERTRSIKVRRMQDELLLARAREELITRDLVQKQAAYLLVALRQRILSIPHSYARRLTGLTDIKDTQRLLREMSLSLLRELRDLPARVVDPQWMDEAED